MARPSCSSRSRNLSLLARAKRNDVFVRQGELACQRVEQTCQDSVVEEKCLSSLVHAKPGSMWVFSRVCPFKALALGAVTRTPLGSLSHGSLGSSKHQNDPRFLPTCLGATRPTAPAESGWSGGTWNLLYLHPSAVRLVGGPRVRSQARMQGLPQISGCPRLPSVSVCVTGQEKDSATRANKEVALDAGSAGSRVDRG